MSSFAQSLVAAYGASPYTPEYCDQIARNKAALHGRLIFEDLLLKSANINNDTEGLYPPRNFEGIIALIKRIENSTAREPTQTILIYYIFLDFPKDKTQDSLLLSEYFAREVDLFEGHQHFAKGYWYLDHLNMDAAFPHICHPKVVVKEAQLLLLFLSESSSRRLVEFINAKHPELGSLKALKLYIIALCNSSKSLYSALQVLRSVSPDKQTSVLGSIVTYALQTNNIKRLTNLPFTKPEQDMLEKVLIDMLKNSPTTETSSKIKDVLLMRYLWGHKNFDAARKLASQGNNAPIFSGNNNADAIFVWEDIHTGLQKSLGTK